MKIKNRKIYQQDLCLAEGASPSKRGKLWFKSSPKETSTFSIQQLHKQNCWVEGETWDYTKGRERNRHQMSNFICIVDKWMNYCICFLCYTIYSTRQIVKISRNWFELRAKTQDHCHAKGLLLLWSCQVKKENEYTIIIAQELLPSGIRICITRVKICKIVRTLACDMLAPRDS